MRFLMNGREFDVPTNEHGDVNVVDVRRVANVPDDRTIIHQKPTGENQIMPKNGRIHINPYDQFMDSPRAKRGQYELATIKN